MITKTTLDLEIIPNAEKFCIVGFNPWTKRLKIRVKNPPVKGRANLELIKELQKIFNAKVTLIQGNKAKKKKIEIALDPKQTTKVLETYPVL